MGAHWLLVDHRVLILTNTVAGSQYTAAVGYYMGEFYYTCRNYATAETYFKYVISQFPESPYTERASVMWLYCLRFGLLRPPAQTIAEYQTFLKKYPTSAYAPMVRKLSENYEGSAYSKMEASPEKRADGIRDLKNN